MKKILYLGIIAFIGTGLIVFYLLSSDKALVTQPKGVIAHSELNLFKANYLLMLIVVVPTLILLIVTAWRYHAKNTQAKYDPEHSYGKLTEVILWAIPSLIVAVMAVINWRATHQLDPYRPLASDVKPLVIQVVALDWKWLFIYPEQGIATVNFIQIPERTPIHFELSADGSPMNSFWIPQLSGQIYAMTGMATKLHVMADGIGVYRGRAAEINGEGLADMTFVAESASKTDFDGWVAKVKRSPLQLTDPTYQELVKPSQNNPIALYSSVEADLFNKIIQKYILWKTGSSEN